MIFSKKSLGWQPAGIYLMTRLFDIREGEVARSLWMFLYLLLFITALMIVKPVSNALFLNQFGARQLPFAYMLTAFSAASLLMIYSTLLKRIPLDRLMKTTLVSAIFLLVILWVFIHFNWVKDVFLYLFFVGVGLFALVCASQFWLAAGIFFNVREAKRLFGPIGSGAIIGGIGGGYITKILAASWGSDNLILISIVCLFFCILIIERLWRDNGRKESEIKNDLRGPATIDGPSPFSRIIRSKHLSYLAAILGISVIVSRLVDYQFNAIVSAQIHDKDQLAAFLGFWMSNLNFLSLLVQLFFTRKIVKTMGAASSLFFLPAAVLGGAVLTLFHPVLWSAVTIKLSEGGFKNSLNKSGMELLFLPIPIQIKNQAKGFIDIFVDSLASGIGGLLLVFLVFGINMSPAHISLVILLLVVVWFFLIKHVKKAYIQSFREKFEFESDMAIHPLGPVLDNEPMIGEIIERLEGNDDRQILKTLHIITQFHHEKLSLSLVKLLDHPLTEIKIEALKQLYFSKKTKIIGLAGKLSRSDSLPLASEAIRYLFHHSQDPYQCLRGFLEDSDYHVQGAALLCLVRESRKNRVLKKLFMPEHFIENLFSQIHSHKDPEKIFFTKKICIQAISMGDDSALYPYLYIFLEDPDQAVVINAIQGAGQTQHSEFIRVLLPFLGKKQAVGEAAANALANYGPLILDFLSEGLSNNYMAYPIRKHLPAVIASFETQKAVDILSRHLRQQDLGLRYEVIRAMNKLRLKSNTLLFDKAGIVSRIKKETREYWEMLLILYAQKQIDPIGANNVPGISTAREQLINALETGLDESLERVFRLLGLKYPPVEIFNAYKGLYSNDSETRLNAIEFLDNVLDINLKNVIMPVVETGCGMMEGPVIPGEGEIPEAFESYLSLLQGQDDFLKEKTLYLLSFMADPRYIPHIAKLLNSPARGVRQMAKTALKRSIGSPAAGQGETHVSGT
ncbi:MAG: hypothetical protein KKC20_14930 [Proteobacteria bacterium]|nr:hypothetical protein [Pseudomonadota bacterium]